MNDKEIKEAIEKKVSVLNILLHEAGELDIEVRLDTTDVTTMGSKVPIRSLSVQCVKYL